MFGSQRRGPRRLLAAGLAAITAGAVLSACTAEDPGTEAPVDTVFDYAVAAVPDMLDLAPFGGLPKKIVYGVLDSTLVRYGDSCDALTGSQSLQPGLATSWDVAPDGVTFHLSDAVSSFGNELTAEDVKWSIERQMANDVSVKANLGTIGAYDVDNLFEIIDDKTIKFNLKSASSFDVTQFASVLTTIRDSTEMKKHATSEDEWALEWARTNLADFGPWQLERYTPSSELVLSANPNYTGERGNITEVQIRAVPESSTRAQLLGSGDVDWVDGLTFSEYHDLQSTDGVTVEDCAAANRDDMFLKQTPGSVFEDVRLRQAVSYAIDRKKIVDTIYFGFGDASESGVPVAYKPSGVTQRYEYSPEKAKELLAEAGYPDGFSFTAYYSPTRPGPYVEQVAIQIQQDLAQVGITMELQQVAGAAEYFDRVVKGNYDAAFYSESTFVGDPTYGAATFALSTSAINSFGYRSERYDSAVRAAQAATGDDYTKKVAAIAEIGVEEIPMVYIVDTANVQAHRSNVSGFANSSIGTVSPVRLTIG